MVNSSKSGFQSYFKDFFSEPITQYTIIVTSSVAILVILEFLFETITVPGWSVPKFLSEADKLFVLSFIEWFGVLYGFLLPAILVRVWEQFDKIDGMFDREADAIKMLIGDLRLLHSQYKEFSSSILFLLREYTQSVVEYINEEKAQKLEVIDGDKKLAQIRTLYLQVFHQRPGKIKESEVLIDELLTQLNNIIDYRGDRISLLTQRLFESLKFIAVLTSIVWLVPFYFLYFQDKEGEYLQLGLFGWLLVISVTFLVIIILTIIHDLDEPFDGIWRMNKTSWENLLNLIDNELVTLRGQEPEDQSSQRQKSVRKKHSHKAPRLASRRFIKYLFDHQSDRSSSSSEP